MGLILMLWVASVVLGVAIDGGRGAALGIFLGVIGLGISCYLHRNDDFEGKAK